MKRPSHSASLEERYLLNPHSTKQTYHLVLDIRNLGLSYGVGDCVLIFPSNDPSHVEEILKLAHFKGDEIIQDRMGASHTLYSFLEKSANLHRLPKELPTNPQLFATKMLPLLPRYYSIASSMQGVGEKIHLLVTLGEYEMEGKRRYGACSYYLTHLLPLQEKVPILLDTNRGFALPPQEKDIIMIGPGTGVAPFKGFMQERLFHAGRNWLFFGERNRAHDFYYHTFWNELQEKNKLRLDLAFSRDLHHKVYVQHLMEKQGSELYSWLEEGAYLYLCGDATSMARDVEKTLLKIISKEGNKSELEAKAYLKSLKEQKRYLKDVY